MSDTNIDTVTGITFNALNTGILAGTTFGLMNMMQRNFPGQQQPQRTQHYHHKGKKKARSNNQRPTRYVFDPYGGNRRW
jgi:hypothetical protein